MKYAIRAGIGVGLIPDYLTEEESDLVPVLQDVQLPTIPIIFVYPEELKTSKKVQVLRDFLVANAPQLEELGENAVAASDRSDIELRHALPAYPACDVPNCRAAM